MPTCDGCGLEGATEVLWLAAPLGDCCVHVHRDRACAEAAREARGGGSFHPERKSKDEKELARLTPAGRADADRRLLAACRAERDRLLALARAR